MIIVLFFNLKDISNFTITRLLNLKVKYFIRRVNKSSKGERDEKKESVHTSSAYWIHQNPPPLLSLRSLIYMEPLNYNERTTVYVGFKHRLHYNETNPNPIYVI